VLDEREGLTMGTLEPISANQIPGIAGGPPSDQGKSDAEIEAEIRRDRANIAKQNAKNQASKRQAEATARNQGNTQGQIRQNSPAGSTPEKKSELDKAKEQVSKGVDANVRDAKGVGKDAIGTNRGRDTLGGGKAASEAIDNGTRLGGASIKFGASGGAGVPGTGQEKKVEMVKKWQVGEPCDDDEDGIGGSGVIKRLNKLKKEKKKVVGGVEVKGKVGLSVSGDLICVKTEMLVKGAAGAGVHAVENSTAGDNVVNARDAHIRRMK
jgi:hypothetical protein